MKIKNKHVDYENKINEFPEFIKELSRNNPIVNACIKNYAYNNLITKEECYCEIIKYLNEQNIELMNFKLDYLRTNRFNPNGEIL